MDEGLGEGYITIFGGDLGQFLDLEIIVSSHEADGGYLH
jgi:hypothetical protein